VENGGDEDCLAWEGNSNGLLGYEMQRNVGYISIVFMSISVLLLLGLLDAC